MAVTLIGGTAIEACYDFGAAVGAFRTACGSPLFVCGDAGGGFEPTGLVVDRDRDVAQLLRVLPAVVGAEKQLPTAGQGDTDVGLRTAAVTTIRGRQGRTRGECCSHLRPHLI